MTLTLRHRPAGDAARRPNLAAGIRPRIRFDRGFSLVEIMMVVLIISVLSMLAVPGIARVKRKAKTAAVVNDFRVFAAAFEAYAHENGAWPAEAAAGVIPPEMTSRLNGSAWTRVTPMGGKYNWEYNQMHWGVRYKAAISISAAAGAPLPVDGNQLIDIERTIDGNASFNWFGGSFHLGASINPLFIIEQ